MSALDSWRTFLKDPGSIDTPSWADRKTFEGVKTRVMEACAQMDEGGALHGLGLSEGEVAALLLCTKSDVSLFQDMQNALSKQKAVFEDECAKKDASLAATLPKKYGSLAATLVSALRKLRAHQKDVNFVCVAKDQLQCTEDRKHWVAPSFIRGTTMVPVGGFKDGCCVLSPFKMHAALIPECLCFTPDDRNVMFEPGTTFTKANHAEFYTQVEPTVEEAHLLFPAHTYFPPLRMKH